MERKDRAKGIWYTAEKIIFIINIPLGLCVLKWSSMCIVFVNFDIK